MLGVYKDFAENVAAVPVYEGVKSANERFPGAVETYSIEALMPDGKVLQSATSHDLGQNFSKAYDISFSDRNQQIEYAYTTSWGMSWRMLGAVIMTHGDDRGLRFPPALAPVEAVFVPIVKGGDNAAVDKSHELAKTLREAGYRVRVDDRDEKPGWKYAEWEMRGVPLRIEIGPKDLENRTAVVVRRDLEKGQDGHKTVVPFDELSSALRGLLQQVHDSLFAQAKAFLESHTFKVRDRDEFFEKLKTRAGMVDVPWCDVAECEMQVKAETGAMTRNIRPLEEPGAACVACGKPAKVNAYFAQSY